MKRAIGLLAGLIAISAYAVTVARVWRAATYTASGNPVYLKRAAALEPWNAEPYGILGRYYLFSVGDANAALAPLRQALELNPGESRYWLDISSAYYVTGDPERSRAALERALQAEPNSPDVLWTAANQYLANNESERGLRLLRRCIDTDVRSPGAALLVAWKATHNVGDVLAYVVPPNSTAYFTLLNLLVEQRELAPSVTVWRDFLNHKIQFATEQAFPFFDFLLGAHEFDEAGRVWSALRERTPGLPGSSGENLVVNGGFEQELLNGGFDWRREEHPDVMRDSDDAHSGSWALRVEFAGESISDTGIRQYVAVQPGRSYELSAFVKTRDLESASGPRLLVEDAESHQPLTMTEDPLGTTPWHQESARFTTGAETRAVIIRIARVPANPLIRGTYWVDDVMLAEAGATVAGKED